jgi:hypothetical protein
MMGVMTKGVNGRPPRVHWRSIMDGKISTLEEDVIAAFERACREQDFVVADHLLKTLEAIAHRSGSEEKIEDAYLHMAQMASRSPKRH